MAYTDDRSLKHMIADGLDSKSVSIANVNVEGSNPFTRFSGSDAADNQSRPDPRNTQVSLISSAFWCAYALVALALGVGRTIEKIIDDSGGLLSRYGPALGATLVAVGVLGYAFRAPIGRAWIWKMVFVLAILGCLGLVALELITLLTGDAPLRIHAMIVGGAALLVPAQIALHRYAFRRPLIWRRDRQA